MDDMKPTREQILVNDPRHPERIADNLRRYEGILRDHRRHASAQICAAFLKEMMGKEYSARATLDAFDWFESGWTAKHPSGGAK